jgi:GNAT superfamily N-acetyltransferase
MIRLINDTDWQAILQIQAAVYPDITPETETVLRSKLLLGPETCLVIVDKNDDVLGYCLAHLWDRTPANLHTIYQPTLQPKLLYIHDMAIAPTHVGKQLGNKMMAYLQQWTKKKGFTEIALVSLKQANSYWLQHGFEHQNYFIDETQYGADASFMLKQI